MRVLRRRRVIDMGFLSFRSRRNLANTASLLWNAYKSLPSPSKDVNWAGMFNVMFLLLFRSIGVSICHEQSLRSRSTVGHPTIVYR